MKKVFIFLVISSFLIFNACFTKSPPIRLYGDTELSNSQGWTLLEKNKPKKAVKFFNSVSDDYTRYLGLGYSYLELKNFSKSEEYFNKALEIKESFSAFAGMAQLKELENKLEDSFYFYKKALEVSEDSNPYIQSKVEYIKGILSGEFLKKLDSETDENKRVKIIEKLLFISPEIVKFRKELIRYYFSKGDYEKVIAHYNKLINYEKTPEKDIRAIYAKSLFKKEMYSSAIIEMEELYKDYPDDLEFERLYYDWKAKLESLKIDKYIKSIKDKESITREELAAILYSKFNNKIDSLPQKPKIILDIGTSWAKDFITKIVFTGIMKIERNHNFNCKKEITRLDMAEILYRFLRKLKIKRLSYGRVRIKDVPKYHFKRRYINFVVKNGIMRLDNKGNFYPTKKITGKELELIIERISSLLMAAEEK